MMKELVQFAQTVVKAVANISPFAISLSDNHGYIIGSTQLDRIGTMHFPSREVIEKNTSVIFDKTKIEKMENVLEGIAFPLQFDHKTVGVLGVIGPPEQVKPYGLLVKNYVEMLWQQTFRQQIADMEVKTKETFAQYILLNEVVEKHRVEHYCKMLGITYGKMNFCIVIDIGNSLLTSAKKHISIEHLKENLVRCTKEAYGGPDEMICTFLNTEKMVVIRQVNSKEEYRSILQCFHDQSTELINLLQIYSINNPLIAAGSLSSSIEEVNQSYQEAERLIRFTKESDMHLNIFTNYNWNIILEQFPLQIPDSFHEKVTFRIKPFLEYDRFNEMAELFITYCENNMNISKTAKALFLHRNTLIYRLNKIEEMTSLNTSNFQDCMILYTVLKKTKHAPSLSQMP
ncbi:sugar diacid recognition domain-containing protein [Oceanobacillus jeddahense]|uniref:sugar diacid recognition domain-containing protein n=1 Tax=Oceanobacillus jeddahense TaxID=1462527 RepID=UPI00362728BF